MDGPPTFRSCHQILGIGRGASGDEVAMAYLRTAMRHHPAGCADETARAQARVRFREAAEAWAVLADGRVASCRGPEGDARALAVFDETLAWRARALADRGLRAETLRDALMQDGCPQSVAWAAAEAAASDAALGAGVPAPPVDRAPAAADADVPVLAAAKAAAAAINEADRRAAGAGDPGAHAANGSAAGGAAAAPARPPDAPAPRFAAGARVAPRAGLRGPATRGVPQPDDEADLPDPFPDLDARLEERVAAAVADLAMVALACVAPVVLLGRALEWSPLGVERIAIAAMLAGAAAWFVRGELAWGATPGKRLLGLSVERLDGGALDPRTAWLRHGLRTMSLLLGGLGFATVAITERRQALHDLLTETRVRSRGVERPELVWGLCAAPPALALLALAIDRLGG
jgi:uncharacterized RDD family membrane protein YckC